MKIIRRSVYSNDLHVLDLPISYSHVRRWQQGAAMSFCFPDLTEKEKKFSEFGATEEEEIEIAMIERTFEEHPIN